MVLMEAECQHAESSRDEGGPFIRTIEPRDALDVALLIEQLGYHRSPDDVAAWIEALTSSPQLTQTAFVACLDNGVVGWIEVSVQSHLQSPPFALIGGLVVKEGLRGRRIGKRLCEAAEVWMRQHSVSVLRVTSRSTRPDAHRFYEQNGFAPTKISHVFEKKILS